MGFKQGLIKSITSPRYASGAASRVGTKLNQYIHRRVLRRFHSGERFVEKDWDNLIILDGCRYDTFKEVNWIDGSCGQCTSPASESLSFIEENFIGQNLHDTVYVSGNPYLYEIPDGTFHALYSCVESDWDGELETVPPEPIVDEAVDASHKHPHKRLIVHFMQPHAPFIGERGRRIEQGGWAPERETDSFIWTDLQYGKDGIDTETVRSLYRENLEYVLQHVEKFLDSVDGKTVITSDHGNLVGERGFPIPVKSYGHPRHYYHSALVTVPWHEVTGERRRIYSEPTVDQQTDIKEDVLDNRLADLGYR